jgi:DNA-binding PadR family transcriptional regulator
LNTKELLLSVLMAGPATGYDIKKILEQEVSKIVDVTISNIYPALNELADEGLVTYERIEQESRPNKKLYEITEAGRAACIDALMTCDARQRLRSEFMFILSFAPYLPKTRIAELLDMRFAENEAARASVDELEREGSPVTGALSPGQRFCMGLGRALIEAERDYITNNRDWLISQAPESIELERIVPERRLGKVAG